MGGGGGGGGVKTYAMLHWKSNNFLSHQFLQPLPVQNRKIEILCQPCCRTERTRRSCCNLGNEGDLFGF